MAPTTKTPAKKAADGATTLEYLQKAIEDIDHARDHAGKDMKSNLDAAVDRMKDIAGDLRKRAEDEAADELQRLRGKQIDAVAQREVGDVALVLALLLLPVVQARQMNEQLPSEFESRFGGELRERSRVVALYPLHGCAVQSVRRLSTIVAGMLLGWTTLESIFAGAIIAISSTTIIAKAFDGQRGTKTQ